MRAFAVVAALSFLSLTAVQVAPAEAEEPEQVELVAELIHSDLPLYTFEWEDFWPRNFYRGEGDDFTFGCESRVAFGDWQFIPNPIDEYLYGWWLRIDNYGVVHCAANLYHANERDALADGEFSRGFFVRLGKARRDGHDWELWAIQEGMVPGSDYVLLARESRDGLIEEFSVLQRRCRENSMRRSEGLDVWNASYCLIKSRAELLAVAESMLVLPPLGTLSRITPPDNDQ